MSNFTDFIGGSGGGGAGRKYVDLIILDRSTTWSPRQDCKAVVTVIGGGGAGVEAYSASYGVTGGGAGGLAQSDVIDLSASTSYTATVGSGGLNNTNAGSSVFSGSGVTTLIGNRGDRGVAFTSGSYTASGGTASGGLYNYTGGDGIGSTGQVTGGGAVNTTGTAYSGSWQYKGGAGTGGAPTGIYINIADFNTGGRGAIDSVIDFYYLIPSVIKTPSRSYTGNNGDTYQQIAAMSAECAPMFVGGCGVSQDGAIGQRGYVAAQSGGAFAGGGALRMPSVNIRGQAGDGGIFGGGGGSAICQDRPVGGKGGDGVVFIAVTEYL